LTITTLFVEELKATMRGTPIVRIKALSESTERPDLRPGTPITGGR
jgi:hypothetical protein